MKAFAVLPVLACLMLAPLASAHPMPEKPVTEQTASTAKSLKDLKLPTQEDIAKMKGAMPDMNGMMSDMMGLMKDENFKSGMKDSMEVFKEKLDGGTFKKQDNGMPDMNAMMGAMLELFGDEEFVGGLVEQIEPMAEMMQKHIPEAAKKSETSTDKKMAKPDWN